jgi:cell division protein FtsZ
MGIGNATGKDKAQEAASMAIASPLLETSIKGATGVILSFRVSPDVGLEDIDTAANMVINECNPDVNLIFGVGFDETLDDEMRITIIATGFSAESNKGTPAKIEAPKAETVKAEAPKKPEPVKAEPAPAKEAPKKPASDELDLDDLFGDIF